jgi:hypothetical protein
MQKAKVKDKTEPFRFTDYATFFLPDLSFCAKGFYMSRGGALDKEVGYDRIEPDLEV